MNLTVVSRCRGIRRSREKVQRRSGVHYPRGGERGSYKLVYYSDLQRYWRCQRRWSSLQFLEKASCGGWIDYCMLADASCHKESEDEDRNGPKTLLLLVLSEGVEKGLASGRFGVMFYELGISDDAVPTNGCTVPYWTTTDR